MPRVQGFRQLDSPGGAVRDGPAEEDRVGFCVEAVEEGCEAECRGWWWRWWGFEVGREGGGGPVVVVAAGCLLRFEVVR